MDERLTNLLNLQAELGGSIPFERWMAEALYHPAHGYYTSQIRTVGRRGDFSTWATLDDSLAAAIASWLREQQVKRGNHVIEIGAGTGHLAKSILRKFAWWARPRYHIVEISPILREIQREALRGLPVTWHDRMQDALLASGGKATIFSNELVDAFPCRVFKKQGTTWRELALTMSDGKFQEVWNEAQLPESTIFDIPWPDGQRVEVHESYRNWLEAWLPAWSAGSLLTIDYGGQSSAVYERRPSGTVRAYAFQQRLEGLEIFSAFGKRDLTADVNFSDLERWGSGLGLSNISLQSLASFLLLQKAEPQAATYEGAGHAFQVLIQQKTWPE